MFFYRMPNKSLFAEILPFPIFLFLYLAYFVCLYVWLCLYVSSVVLKMHTRLSET